MHFLYLNPFIISWGTPRSFSIHIAYSAYYADLHCVLYIRLLLLTFPPSSSLVYNHNIIRKTSYEYHIFWRVMRNWLIKILATEVMLYLEKKVFSFSFSFKNPVQKIFLQSQIQLATPRPRWHVYCKNIICWIALTLNAIVSHFWIYLYLYLIPLCGFVWWPLNSGILPFRERINLLCLPLSLLREISFLEFSFNFIYWTSFQIFIYVFKLAFVITWFEFSQMYWIIFQKIFNRLAEIFHLLWINIDKATNFWKWKSLLQIFSNAYNKCV